MRGSSASGCTGHCAEPVDEDFEMEAWSTGQLATEDGDCVRFDNEVWSTGHEAGAEGGSGGCCFAIAEWSTGQRVDGGLGKDGCGVEDEVWPISENAKAEVNKPV